MRRFISTLMMLAVIVIGVGLWRGWFIVDRERIHEDTQKAIDKVKDTSNNILKKDKSD